MDRRWNNILDRANQHENQPFYDYGGELSYVIFDADTVTGKLYVSIPPINQKYLKLTLAPIAENFSTLCTITSARNSDVRFTYPYNFMESNSLPVAVNQINGVQSGMIQAKNAGQICASLSTRVLMFSGANTANSSSLSGNFSPGSTSYLCNVSFVIHFGYEHSYPYGSSVTFTVTLSDVPREIDGFLNAVNGYDSKIGISIIKSSDDDNYTRTYPGHSNGTKFTDCIEFTQYLTTIAFAGVEWIDDGTGRTDNWVDQDGKNVSPSAFLSALSTGPGSFVPSSGTTGKSLIQGHNIIVKNVSSPAPTKASPYFEVLPILPSLSAIPILKTLTTSLAALQVQQGNEGRWLTPPEQLAGDFTCIHAALPTTPGPNVDQLFPAKDMTFESWIRTTDFETDPDSTQKILGAVGPTPNKNMHLGLRSTPSYAFELAATTKGLEAGTFLQHNQMSFSCWYYCDGVGTQNTVICLDGYLRTPFFFNGKLLRGYFELIYDINHGWRFNWSTDLEVTVTDRTKATWDPTTKLQVADGWNYVTLCLDFFANEATVYWKGENETSDPHQWSSSDATSTIGTPFNLIEAGNIHNYCDLSFGKNKAFPSDTLTTSQFAEITVWSKLLGSADFSSLFDAKPSILASGLLAYWDPQTQWVNDTNGTETPNLVPEYEGQNNLMIDASDTTTAISTWKWTKPSGGNSKMLYRSNGYALVGGSGWNAKKTLAGSAVWAGIDKKWMHVAMSTHNNTAVHFDGSHLATVKGSEGMSFENCFSIDGRMIFDRPVTDTTPAFILSKADIEEDGEFSYQLYIDANDTLVIEVGLNEKEENTSGLSIERWVTGLIIPHGTPLYLGISLTLSSQEKMSEAKFKVDGELHSDQTADIQSIQNTVYNFLNITAAIRDLSAGNSITIVDTTINLTDNVEYAFQRSSAAVVLGGKASSSNPFLQAQDRGCFNGEIGDLRIWATEIGGHFYKLSEIERIPAMLLDGLEVHWKFKEGEGSTISDSIGGHDAQLESADLWVDSRLTTQINLFINGTRIPGENFVEAIPSYSGQNFYLGVNYNPDTTLSNPFKGQMKEIKLWNKTRTAAEISEDLNVDLTGLELSLAAYWPIKNGSGLNIMDYGINQNHLALQTTVSTYVNSGGTTITVNLPDFWWKPSSLDKACPIGNEAPQLTNGFSLSGQVAGELAVTGGKSLSAIEYGTAELDEEGNPRAVLKRFYAYLTTDPATKKPVLNIESGFKVGDATLHFLGQAQSDPSLIGYIEGAPPVPGENLTRPYYNSPGTYQRYNGVSKVALTEDDDVNYSYSSQKNTGFDMSGSYGAKLGVKVKFNLLTAPLGIGTEKNLAEVNAGISQKVSLGMNMGWLQANNVSYGTKTTMYHEVTSGGDWGTETSGDERFYALDNTGYAFVKSGVANVYGMRLKKTNTLISIFMLPDPNIREDYNIIHFPINPYYTKQGTLDGMVGLDRDPDYPTANVERGSYFQPRESQNLEDQIMATEAALEADYQNFEAGAKGRRQKDTHFSETDPAKNPAASLEQEKNKAYDWEKERSRRNLVNTYVWTAAGGLFKEEEQALASRSESFGGSYSFNGNIGRSLNVDTNFGGLLLGINADMLLGGHIQTTVNKSKSEGHALKITAANDTEPYLKTWEADSASPGSDDTPGKVKAFRYKSFYLAPESDHFDDFFKKVIDPKWLRFSNDPAAAALRQAQTAKNSVWRSFHRVTYVERVPPTLGSAPTQSKVAAERTIINLKQNQKLINLVKAALLGNQTTWTKEKVKAAVTAVLATNTGTVASDSPLWKEFLTQNGVTASTDSIAFQAGETLERIIASYMIAYFKVE